MSLYGMSGCHYSHPVIQQDQLSVETEVNYKITLPFVERETQHMMKQNTGGYLTIIPRARVGYDMIDSK